MPETKKTESLKAAAKAPVAAPAAKEEVKTAAAEVKAEAKKPAVKKASAPAAKKPAVKKAAVKTEEKKPVKKEAKAEKKPAAKKETKAASTEVKTNIVLQWRRFLFFRMLLLPMYASMIWARRLLISRSSIFMLSLKRTLFTSFLTTKSTASTAFDLIRQYRTDSPENRL